MPLGLLYSYSKPSIENRIMNMLSAFTDRLDHTALTGVDTQTVPPPSFDAAHLTQVIEARLTSYFDTLGSKQHNTVSNITFNTKTEEFSSLVKTLHENFDTKLDLVRKEQAAQHKTTMRYLEALTAKLDKQLTRSNAQRSSRSVTPRPEQKPVQLIDKPANSLEAALSSARRPLSPESLPSHSRTNSLNTLTDPREQRRSYIDPPSLKSLPSHTEAEQALFEEDDSDSESNHSAATTSTMLTHTTSKSHASDRTDASNKLTNRNVWSCSPDNIKQWMDYIHRKSSSFQKSHRSSDKASEIAKSIFDKHIDTDNVSPDFKDKILEELTYSIRERRKPPPSNKNKKHSHSKEKTSLALTTFSLK
jgi:hypothetical protein